MNRELVNRFRKMFEDEKSKLAYQSGLIDESFHLRQDDLLDEVDLTSSEIETGMRMRLRNRETLYLKKIDEALRRIADGSFGACSDCGDEIELSRLEARPTASHCVDCKEEQERREHTHIDGHAPKSLGRKLRLA